MGRRWGRPMLATLSLGLVLMPACASRFAPGVGSPGPTYEVSQGPPSPTDIASPVASNPSIIELCSDAPMPAEVPAALCVVSENHSPTDMALIWTSSAGGGFERMAACFATTGYQIQPPPWTLEVGVAPVDSGDQLVGEPLATFTSDQLAGSGSPTLSISVAADGKVTIGEAVESPLPDAGALC